MKQNGLESRFRNLLITLARDAEDLRLKVDDIRQSAERERNGSRRDALRAVAAERNKQRSRLLFLLGKNSAASRFFFGTVNPQEISSEQLLFASKNE